MICYKVENREDLLKYGKILFDNKVSFQYFLEPDIGCQETALAYISVENLFTDCLLL